MSVLVCVAFFSFCHSHPLQVYNDLSHPPATFIGPQHAFRTADGSNNNPDFPDLGKAGTPYARSVQQGNPLPRNQLPDAGLVFDTLLRRDEVRSHWSQNHSPRLLMSF